MPRSRKTHELPIVFCALDVEGKTKAVPALVCPDRGDVMTVGNCGRCHRFRRIDFTKDGEPLLRCTAAPPPRTRGNARGAFSKRVQDLVQVPVVCTAPDTALAVVLPYLMLGTHLEAIPVLGLDARPIGFLTIREARRLYAAGVPLETELWELMSREVVCVPPETTLDEARRLIEETGTPQLFAVSTDGTFIGVVSARDLFMSEA